MARLTNAEKVRRYREKVKAIRKAMPKPTQDVYISPSGLSYVRNSKGIALPFVRGYYTSG